MPALHFDVKPMTGRPKFIVRHSTVAKEIAAKQPELPF
jgi:hypothetical protein